MGVGTNLLFGQIYINIKKIGRMGRVGWGLDSEKFLCRSATDWLYYIFTARKRSLGQGNVLHLCVILFTGGGGLPTPHSQTWGLGRPPDADPPRQTPWMQTPLGLGRSPWMQIPWGWAGPPGMQTPQMQNPRVGQTPQMQTAPGLARPPDTVNKRAVRILMECILCQNHFIPEEQQVKHRSTFGNETEFQTTIDFKYLTLIM